MNGVTKQRRNALDEMSGNIGVGRAGRGAGDDFLGKGKLHIPIS